MRTFYVRRKDLSHVPFQYYVNADGSARPLDKGYTSTFAIMPIKNDFDVMHVHIVDAFVHEMEKRWGITEPDLLRVTAKALEAWLKNEPVPQDHFYGPGMIKVDADWYPRDPDDSPAMAADPYSFMVETDEPGPSIMDWESDRPSDTASDSAGEPQAESSPSIVFGFTVDICPALLILGYEQFRKRATEKGLGIDVRLVALSDLPEHIHTLFVPPALAQAARQSAPNSRIIALEELVNNPIYDAVIEVLEREHASAGKQIERA